MTNDIKYNFHRSSALYLLCDWKITHVNEFAYAVLQRSQPRLFEIRSDLHRSGVVR